MAEHGLQVQSLVNSDGILKLSLVETPIPQPGPDEVLVKIEAAPIHPADLGQLFGPADLASAMYGGTPERPVLSATIPPSLMPMLAARLGQPLLAGNEGSGLVVKAGQQCRHLEGRTVAMLGGGMYAQYQVVPAHMCLPVPDGVDFRDCAASQVNPLTALGLVETMKMEGHKALVNTAAASTLGQMLVRICLQDDIALVSIVRSEEQVTLLKETGARYVINMNNEDFMPALTEALAATGATIAFDATGGGKLGGQILTAMEQVALRKMKTFSRYGSDTFKQLYMYGNLDTSPTTFHRTFGVAWSIGAWLLTPFLHKAGPARIMQLQQRIAGELTTTFRCDFAGAVTLAGMLDPASIARYASRRTRSKYLVTPWG